MVKRNRFPVQLDKNDHQKLKLFTDQSGLGMNIIIHKLLKVVSEKAKYIDENKKSHLSKYHLFELIHLKEIDVISEEEFEILAFNESAQGIVLDMVWADDLLEKREILDIYDILNNVFV